MHAINRNFIRMSIFFSASNLVASQQRAALKPENVDAIIFLNRNIKEQFGLKPLGEIAGALAKQESGSAEASAAIRELSLPDLAFDKSWEDM